MARRSSRRRSRRLLTTRAPRKGTLIIASIFYIVGLFGVLGFFPIPEPYATAALAIAGGLLILGAFLRDL
ncbi:MAG: hypothetical protein DRI79_06845 [Chloroflexi bacterium]|nr:MAG: hypothetical protein DRI80_11150 [Chloroflexota bacterium]RLC89465.1 MAG: hypothetical protein DRI79_06845 [Chloroflexota bacterium]HEY68109.1 hypothetical protein [Thermoflexia bacterium]